MIPSAWVAPSSIEYTGTLWKASCGHCDWQYLAAAEMHAVLELDHHLTIHDEPTP